MGKGLMVKPSGVHIAFAGGTGILCFVDLIAHMIQVNLNLLNDLLEEEEYNTLLNISSKDAISRLYIDRFELHLFVSYPSL